MKNKQEMPAFYGRNIAQHAQREVRRRQVEGKQTRNVREETVMQVIDCFMEALAESGVGKDKMLEIARTADKETQLFRWRSEFSAETVRWATGKAGNAKKYARDMLMKQTKELLPNGFCLPEEDLPIKQRKSYILRECRDAADITARLYALACREVLEYGKDEIGALIARMDGSRRQPAEDREEMRVSKE